MDNVQTKVPSNRRGKFVVFGFLLVIFVMLFHLYREHNFKKDMIRRKAFLIAKLRDSKSAELKLSYVLEGKKRELISRQTELQRVQKELTDAKSSYQRQMAALKDLEKSAIERKENLAALQKQHSNASSTIKALADKLTTTVNSCEDIRNKNKVLNKEIKQKENHVMNCSQENESLSKAYQDMDNFYKNQITLLKQNQVVGTGMRSTNIMPLSVQNQQSASTSPVNIPVKIPNPLQSIPPSITASTTHQNLKTHMAQTVTELENQITKHTDVTDKRVPDSRSTTSSNIQDEDGKRIGENVI